MFDLKWLQRSLCVAGAVCLLAGCAPKQDFSVEEDAYLSGNMLSAAQVKNTDDSVFISMIGSNLNKIYVLSKGEERLVLNCQDPACPHEYSSDCSCTAINGILGQTASNHDSL